jgi:Ni,Fe-hydrogenase I large subunit
LPIKFAICKFAVLPQPLARNAELGIGNAGICPTAPGRFWSWATGGRHGEAWQHYDGLILDMYKKMGGPSLHLRQIARMHETVKLYRQAERCLREFRLNDLWYIKPRERDGRGWGATEAIRGALCHWIEVKDGKIKNYQIIAPTTWNVGPRDANRNLGPIEQALIGAPIADPTDPVEVGHVARSFDSCLVCTVHAHDGRTGEELARFRIG